MPTPWAADCPDHATADQLADRLGVDRKTVERWITLGRTPYPRSRHAIAAIVGEGEAYLWPDALPADRRTEVAESEVVQVYPHRAAVPADLWARMLKGAGERIDVLVYAGPFLSEQNARLLALLRARAEAGAKVRMLLGDPECAAVAARGTEEISALVGEEADKVDVASGDGPLSVRVRPSGLQRDCDRRATSAVEGFR